MERNSDDWILTAGADVDASDVQLKIDSMSLRVLNYTLNENLYNQVNRLF